MLSTLGVPIMRVGSVVELDAGRFSGELPAFEIRVPGDLSSAAFLLAAALVVPGSEVGVRTISANPTRAGVVEVMRAMGGAVELTPHDEQVGEPVGDVFAAHRELRGAMIAGEVVTRAIDEIPVLLALAARAKGTTTVHDASELRVKESDRIASMACVLRAFGVACEERADGIEVEGRPEGRLTAATVSSDGDHRVAMSAAILGLAADGPTRIRDVDCIATSFPRFVGTLRALGANIEVVS
jgi:3-phosphoshikimate 1-carboxyvinyltransferase